MVARSFSVFSLPNKRFIVTKGFQILKIWLLEAKKDRETSLLLHILKLLQHLPLNYDVLKSSGIGKTVKGFIKSEFSNGNAGNQIQNKFKDLIFLTEIRQISSELIDSWTLMLTESEGT